MKIKFKYDYCKDAPRKQVTTTINKDLHKKLQMLSVNTDIPTSKMYDVMLMDIFESEESTREFINRVKAY